MLSSSKPQNSNNRDYPNNYSRQSAVQNAPPSDPVRDRLQANLRAANSSLERRNAAKENLTKRDSNIIERELVRTKEPVKTYSSTPSSDLNERFSRIDELIRKGISS